MELVELLEKTIDEKKGEHITRIDFQSTHAIFDQMIICDVNNNRLLQAIIRELEDACDEAGYHEYHHEGNDNSDWILFYCDHIAVSVFLEEARTYYNIERLWQEYVVK